MANDLPTIKHRSVGRLATIEREIERARRTLKALWRAASPADRLFAVDRLLNAVRRYRNVVARHVLSAAPRTTAATGATTTARTTTSATTTRPS